MKTNLYYHIITLLIILCPYSLNAKSKDRNMIIPDKDTKIEFLSGTNDNEQFRITVINDIYKLNIPDKSTKGNRPEYNITLSKQQTDSIDYLLSNIERKLNVGITNQHIHHNWSDAILYVDGEQIYYTTIFQLPYKTNRRNQEIEINYHNNQYLDKLLKFIIDLSPVKLYY